ERQEAPLILWARAEGCTPGSATAFPVALPESLGAAWGSARSQPTCLVLQLHRTPQRTLHKWLGKPKPGHNTESYRANIFQFVPPCDEVSCYLPTGEKWLTSGHCEVPSAARPSGPLVLAVEGVQ
uniref:Uncharacterized protein n=1 Tax=Anas platyrhynchos platyrhynchos TaxID=8840 RepID=A0A493T9P8_ANAPP